MTGDAVLFLKLGIAQTTVPRVPEYEAIWKRQRPLHDGNDQFGYVAHLPALV